jgi:crotonobetainyl-CoA:carnitine CoA-transferase CaiB-like acyl-CoA transferase
VSAGALDGVRVLDLTAGLAGPVAGMLLADLGADVVKVYPPGGGPSPAEPGLRVWDRNKRSAVFDASRSGDLAALDTFVAGADVVLAGTTGHGVSYEDLRRRGLSPGPASSWIVMPAYLLGETPWAAEQESAGLVHAWLGHAWSQASHDDVPVECLFLLACCMQGIWAATVAAALIAGARRGRRQGQIVVAGGAHGGVLVSPGGFAIGRDEPHVHRPGGPGGALPNYRCYRCSDGTWLFFGAFTSAFIDRGLRAVGAGHVLTDPRVGGDPANVRLPGNIGWITGELERVFLRRPRAEWVDLLEAADVPVAAVLGPAGWLDHEQVKALGLRAEVPAGPGGDVVMPGVFVGLSETPASLRSAAPTRHTAIADLARGYPFRMDHRSQGTEPQCPPGLPLEGMRVLDLGTVIAGPYVATLLGELGADVLKIEKPPGGDEYRTAHGGRGGVGFPVFNPGKRSLMIDLAHGGLDVFLRLARTADVVVDNYRPGVAGRLGVSREHLAAVNPRVTSVSVSAFGDAGPFGRRPGFDPVVQAMSGIMRAQGGEDDAESPVFLTVPVNDVIAAGLGALGACAALAARERTGRGQQVSVTLCAVSCLVQSERLVRFAGRPPQPDGGRDFAGPDPLSRLYQAVGGWVRFGGRWPEDFPALAGAGLALAAAAGGVPAGPAASAAGGVPAGPAASAAAAASTIARAVAPLPVAEVLRRAAGAGIPAVRARQAGELLGDEQLIRHGLLTVLDQDDAGPARVGPGHWLEMPGLVRSPPGTAPSPGEHSRAILLEAGLGRDDAERLERAGVVVTGAAPG